MRGSRWEYQICNNCHIRLLCTLEFGGICYRFSPVHSTGRGGEEISYSYGSKENSGGQARQRQAIQDPSGALIPAPTSAPPTPGCRFHSVLLV